MLPEPAPEAVPELVSEQLDSSPVDPFSGPPRLPARVPFWTYTDLLLVMGILTASIAAIVVGAGVLVALYPRFRDDPTPLLLPLQVAFYGGLYLALFLTFRTRYRQPVFFSLGWRRTEFNLAVAAVGGAILAFVVSGLAWLLHTPQVPSPLDRFMNSPFNLALIGILAVTLAPLFEERYFRGFLQPLVSHTFGVAAGNFITAIIFGSLHAPVDSWAWQYAVAVALVGIVLGWVRARSGSIIPSTLMHASYNSVFVIALLVSKHANHL